MCRSAGSTSPSFDHCRPTKRRAHSAVLQLLLLATSLPVLHADIKGVRVAASNNMGRVAIATRDFSAGELVLNEQPVLIWRHGDYHSLITNFLSAGPREQAAVNDMFSLDVSVFSKRLSLMSKEFSEHLSPDEILGLIQKVKGNQIQYSDEGDALFDLESCTLAALFEYGSKLSHSCNPNTRAEVIPETIEHPRRSMGFRAIRPIKEGEQVTFTYAYFGANDDLALSEAEILVNPTNQRRTVLEHNFRFVCHCARCDGPDFCRPLKCGSENCAEFVLLDGKTEEWSCPKCGTLTPPAVQVALTFEEHMASTCKEMEALCRPKRKPCQPATKSSRGELPHPAAVEALIHECSELLGPTHYLVLKMLTTLAKLCKDHADQIPGRISADLNADPQFYFTQAELLAKAARTLMLKATSLADVPLSTDAGSGTDIAYGATRLECVDAGCLRGAPCCDHSPVFFCYPEAEMALLLTEKLPPHHRDRQVLEFTARYAEVMRLSIPMAPGSTHLDHDKQQTFLRNQEIQASSLAWTATDPFLKQAGARGIKLGTKVWIVDRASEHNGKEGTVVEFG